MDRNPRRRPGGLASLLPSMLLVALLGSAGGTLASGESPAEAPVVDLTVTPPGR